MAIDGTLAELLELIGAEREKFQTEAEAIEAEFLEKVNALMEIVLGKLINKLRREMDVKLRTIFASEKDVFAGDLL